jgi:DNA-binding LacI/PurR family transcriptional regulator
MNIYDLAKEAGVSIATASKALNGRRDVNEQTRQRVLDVAKKLNYHPSHLARGLARRRTENIGCVALRRFKVPFFTNAFYSRVLEGMETEITARSYNLLLSVLPAEDPSQPLQLPKLVREKNADGLVLLGEMPEALLKEVFERRIPSVIVDFFSPKLEAHYILSDNRGGLRLLVKHVADLKHRRLAFVQSSSRDYSFVERQLGFEQACTELKLQGQVWPMTGDWPEVEAELKKRLLSKDRPTAILACNDEHALAVIRMAREVGLRVPQDLSVGGFDDIDAAALHQPSLTTLRVDKQEMGVRAIQTVFRLLEPPLEPSGRTELPVALVARQSTGIAPE